MILLIIAGANAGKWLYYIIQSTPQLINLAKNTPKNLKMILVFGKKLECFLKCLVI